MPHAEAATTPRAPRKRTASGTTYDAYCEMATGAGGWTLVGRSVSGGTSSSFGWRKDTGSIGDDTKVYSLDTARAELTFEQLLIGTYTAGKTWGVTYEMVPPANFPSAFTTSYTGVCKAAVIKGGSCTLTTPYVLRYLGQTDRGDQFFIRDNTSALGYGLFRTASASAPTTAPPAGR